MGGLERRWSEGLEMTCGVVRGTDFRCAIPAKNEGRKFYGLGLRV